MSHTRPIVIALVAVTSAALTTLGSTAATAPQQPAGAGAPVTFSQQIAPLIFDRCAGCHRPDGSAPFSLLTYAEVRQRATLIAAVTRTRFMPPWKTEPGYGEFLGQKQLSDADISLIQRWIDGGLLEGNPRDLPAPPRWTPGWQLGTPDLIVAMPQPYVLRADGPDVFRTFVIRIPTTEVRYVKGLEFRPSNPRVLHHANIRIDRTPASRDLDAQDAMPGYDGAMAHSAQFPDGHFLAWTPGQVSPLLPKGLAWRLDPGTDLVFQLHLQPSGKPENVQVSIGLFFGTDPPERTPSILRLARENIEIPAGDAGYIVEDSYTLPVDVEVQAVQPHAHARAREIRGVATLPDGTMKWLVYIKDWDFRWQHVYRYVTPVALPRGSTVSMRYTYDNSADNPRNPGRPPVPVHYGWQTTDEMGELYIQALTRSENDREALDRAFERKEMTEDLAGYESLIARNAPGSAGLHDDAAFLYLELGQFEQAIGHFEAAIQPGAPFSYFNLGTALMMAGRPQDAERRYREAVRLDPDYAVAHDHLGKALLQLGQPDAALREYREAVRSAPSNSAAHNNLGLVLMQLGNLDEAMSSFQNALRADPASVDAQYNLGHVLQRRGQLADARAHFEEAVRLNPGDPSALRSLAWILATADVSALRDGRQALRDAEQAVRLTSRQDASALDALAAAYAESGMFGDAIATIGDAIRLDHGETIAALMQREAIYKRNQPYRERAEPAPPAR